MSKHICIICGKEFYAKQGDAKFCSKDCRKQYYDKKYLEEKTKKLLSEGDENVDYVIDRWNGLPTIRIYGAWFKKMHPDRTLNEYKKEFPDALLTIPKDKENTSKNSGQFMKQDKYRLKYSLMFKGNNNPNHKSNTTEQERKERFPFSDVFYLKRNLSIDDKKIFINKVAKNRSYNTQLNYYLNKGYTEDKAIKLLYNRQKTFTLEKCIKKYGEVEGVKKFRERQEKWKSKVYGKDKCISVGRSIFADKLIEKILINELNLDSYRYGLNEKIIWCDVLKKPCKYDLTNIKTKKIIEFNGDYWHCNPQLYEAEYFNKSINMYAKDKWKLDKFKIQSAKDNGYEILIIWENEYKKDPDSIIKKCKEFLNAN